MELLPLQRLLAVGCAFGLHTGVAALQLAFALDR
ncbi:exported hypothetical protein [Xanthomonas citri pv. citri]|nr:exported hypothetical protein [Xanthomonas citri pv. citri]